MKILPALFKIPVYFISVAVLVSACSTHENDKKLPVFGQRLGDTTKMVDGKEVKDTIYHTIPDFKVTDQDGKTITQADFAGKIYVADFFFTSCPSICPITEPNMLKVQKKFKNVDDLKMISFSIDPRHDSVPVLKEYASRLGADTRQWYFVRGDEDQIYSLAQKGFLASAQKDSAAPGGFLHSGAFILVDKDRRIRGIYNGVDSASVNKLIQDIPVLFKEYHETVKPE